LVLLALVALNLSGCASDANFLRPDGAAPDPKRLESDASDCREILPAVGGFFGGALMGAAEGATAGALSGGVGLGAIVGAGAGGLIGLVAGAAGSASGGGYDSCMARKGYHRA
jgi:hypothetical protein